MMNKEKVIEIFNSNGDDLFNAIENGNHKKTDRIAKKLEKVYIAFVSDNKLARECFPILLKSDNVAIRHWIAGFALGLGMFVNEAETELYDISSKEYGINSLVAEYTLKTWKEQGQLYGHLIK